MKRCYWVCYDISDEKRLRRVAKVMEGFGQRVQKSVFRCEVTSLQRVKLEEALTGEIKHDEDQVLILDLGPPGERVDEMISALGRVYIKPERRAFVI